MAVTVFYSVPVGAVTPADCPTVPNDPYDNTPYDVQARIAPRPGMPRGGYVGVQLDPRTANGTLCTPHQPNLPRDVLHGDESTDVLSGRPREEIIVEPQ